MTREDALRLIDPARGPADLFGADAARSYRRLARLTRTWDTYYILPEGASHAGDATVLRFWRDGGRSASLPS